MARIQNFNNQQGATFNDNSITLNASQTNIQKNTENVLSPAQSNQEETEASDSIQIRRDSKGVTKADLCRIINSMYLCGFFETTRGGKPNKKDVFLAFGKMLGDDLSDYAKHLSASKNVNNDSKATSAVFDKLKTKAEEYAEGSIIE